MVETAVTNGSSLKAAAKKPVVFLMASGGRDSSVAAGLLLRAGYDVRMFYIKGWAPEGLECLEPAEKEMAARVAYHYGVDFMPIHAWSDIFYDAVFSPMISGYLNGTTPNPDTLCNREIKFKVFAHYAFRNGAECIASGHYVRKSDDPLRLLVGRDSRKDQSYFLYDIKRDILSRALFPMGEYIKEIDTNRMVKEFGLPDELLTKRPTVDICFLLKKKSENGDPARITMEELLRREGEKRGIAFQPGPIVHSVTGKIVGEHNGVMMYAATIGQRHGLGIRGGAGSPLYVAGKDIASNTLLVSDKKPASKGVLLRNLNWISGKPSGFPFRCHAKVRTPSKAVSCRVELARENELRVFFDESQTSVASGQACVLYDGEIVLGGGTIVG